ncbi:MAG: hypothetical protein ABJN69_17060 [Hellea sp.]
MQPFENREEIELWLKTQPHDVISIFAARAALRSLPFIEKLLLNKSLKHSAEVLILSSFWSIAATLPKAKWIKEKEKDIFRSAANAANAASSSAAKTIGKNVPAAYGSFAAAANAAAAAAATTTDGAANAAAYSAKAAAYAYPAINSNDITAKAVTADGITTLFFKEFSLDRDFVNTGLSSSELLKKKLWQSATNKSEWSQFRKDIDHMWSSLKNYLVSREQDWRVWTEWYEDRVGGSEQQLFKLPFTKEIEVGIDPENGQFGRVTFPPEDYEEPAKVNAQIKQVVEDYWDRQKQLKQDKTAETFGLDADGQITRTTSETSSKLADTPEQREWYNNLRQAALGIKDIGENALGKAARPVNNVLDALPEDINNAKVARLWPAANRIRKLKAAHDRAIESEDDYHPNRLADEVVDDIGQFVDVYNNLVVGDAGLSEKDKAAKGPQEPEADIEAREAAARGIEAAIEHGLFTEEAQVVIEDDIAEDREIIAKVEADTALTVLESLAQANIQIEKENAIRAIILRVRENEKFGDIGKGARLAIGASIVAFVGSMWPALLRVVIKIFGL